LVIDENERWIAHSSRLIKYESRIVEEGRKVGMYLFITSKSAKAQKVGDTALRDGCVSSYVFKSKPKVAQTFLQDKDKVQLVKALKRPGEALFVNASDEAKIVTLPLATPYDMQFIKDQLTPKLKTRPITHQIDPELDTFAGEVLETSHPLNSADLINEISSVNKGVDSTESEELTEIDQADVFAKIREKLDKKEITLTALAESIGVDKSFLSRVIRGQQKASEKLKTALTAYFSPVNT